MDIDATTKKIVKAILDDVTDRRGWRQEWDEFDEDVQEEIKETWSFKIKTILTRENR